MCMDSDHSDRAESAAAEIPACQQIRVALTLLLANFDIRKHFDGVERGTGAFHAELTEYVIRSVDPDVIKENIEKIPDEVKKEAHQMGTSLDPDAMQFHAQKALALLIVSAAVALTMFPMEDGEEIPETPADLLRQIGDTAPDGIIDEMRSQYERKKETGGKLSKLDFTPADMREAMESGDTDAVSGMLKALADTLGGSSEIVGDLGELSELELDDLPVLDHDPEQEALDRLADDGGTAEE